MVGKSQRSKVQFGRDEACFVGDGTEKSNARESIGGTEGDGRVQREMMFGRNQIAKYREADFDGGTARYVTTVTQKICKRDGMGEDGMGRNGTWRTFGRHCLRRVPPLSSLASRQNTGTGVMFYGVM